MKMIEIEIGFELPDDSVLDVSLLPKVLFAALTVAAKDESPMQDEYLEMVRGWHLGSCSVA
jgi:hypothetical protein